jgi:hypothetical protein
MQMAVLLILKWEKQLHYQVLERFGYVTLFHAN